MVDLASVTGRRTSRSSAPAPNGPPFTTDQISQAFGIPGLTLGERLKTWKKHDLWVAEDPDGRRFVARDLGVVLPGDLIDLAPGESNGKYFNSTSASLAELDRRIIADERLRGAGFNIPQWQPVGGRAGPDSRFVAVVGHPPRAVVVQEWIQAETQPFQTRTQAIDFAWKRGEQYARFHVDHLRYVPREPEGFARVRRDWGQLHDQLVRVRSKIAKKLAPLLPFLEEVTAALSHGYYESRVLPDSNVNNCIREKGTDKPFFIDGLDRELGPLDREVSRLVGYVELPVLDRNAIPSARLGVGVWIATMDGYFAGLRESGKPIGTFILQAQQIPTEGLAVALDQVLDTRSSRNDQELDHAFEVVMACRFAAAAQPELEDRSWAVEARSSAYALASGRAHGGAVL